MSLTKILPKEISQSQKQSLTNMGLDVVEEETVGEYEIVLVEDINRTGIYQETNYSVGFQRKGRDFISPSDQMSKQAPDELSLNHLKQTIPLEQMIPILKSWVEQYGKIAIGSYNPRKTKIYKKIFDRYEMNNKVITLDFIEEGFEIIILL